MSEKFCPEALEVCPEVYIESLLGACLVRISLLATIIIPYYINSKYFKLSVYVLNRTLYQYALSANND